MHEDTKKYYEWTQQLLKDRQFFQYLLELSGDEMMLEDMISMAGRMSDREFWKCVHDVWTNSDVTYTQKENWLAVFESNRPGREAFMDKSSLKLFKGLSDDLIVYRGYTIGNAMRGMSWTPSLDIAKFFAFDCEGRPGNGRVIRGFCRKNDVLGFTNARQEYEIIINPCKVRRIAPIRLEPHERFALGPSQLAEAVKGGYPPFLGDFASRRLLNKELMNMKNKKNENEEKRFDFIPNVKKSPHETETDDLFK